MGVSLLALAVVAAAGDWPQWRFDANRSGATDEPCGADLKPLWSLSLPRPDPAFDHQYRMCADAAYAPVAAEGLLFVPSNSTDQVIACDLHTGAVRWRRFAESPVRFAPGIPRPRTCGRIIGNNSLLVYRDAATEFYDVVGNRMIGFNSVRAGCTTSFIPAGGVMTAPMLGHGCVCNYPMFASLGLYHWPGIDEHRPAAVKANWVNQTDALLAANAAAAAADPFAASASGTVDLDAFRLTNSVVERSGNAALFRTKDRNAGYAVRAAAKPLQRATFSFSLKRAAGNQVTGRHGNAFFVCGASPAADRLIECRLYYGGRSSLMITGSQVEHVEQKVSFSTRGPFTVDVTVDCDARTVTFAADGKRVTSKTTAPIAAITHYGYGGANSDTLFTAITVN